MIKSQYIEDAVVISNNWVTADTLELVVKSPQIATVAESGQFVMVSCAKTGRSPLLRRPISLYDINGDNFSLLYKVVGAGTELMAEMKAGEKVSMLGPLGEGFRVKKAKHHCLVGGGIGIAPLYHLARMIRQSDEDCKITILEGARNSKELLILEEFKPFGQVLVSTDDGSEGHHGFVTELLSRLSTEELVVYTCGPTPMMKGVAAICRDHQWQCQVSMETHMACGMGACLGCSFPRSGEHDGVEKYVHVCKDGPVFDAEVIWA